MNYIDSRNVTPSRTKQKGEWSGRPYLESVPKDHGLIWNQNYPSWMSSNISLEIPIIIIGKCKNQAWNGGSGHGSQRYGCFIKQYNHEGHWVNSVFVPASKRFDPNKKNKMGKMGAYVVVPPSDEEIEQAIALLT